MQTAKMVQTCWTFNARELAEKLGMAIAPDEWVVVEVDEDTVDVMVRKRVHD